MRPPEIEFGKRGTIQHKTYSHLVLGCAGIEHQWRCWCFGATEPSKIQLAHDDGASRPQPERALPRRIAAHQRDDHLRSDQTFRFVRCGGEICQLALATGLDKPPFRTSQIPGELKSFELTHNKNGRISMPAI